MIGQLKFLLGILFASIWTISCKPEKQTAEKQKYFDTEKYFSNEVVMLNAKSAAITKTFFKNGISETSKVEKVKWRTELEPFFQIGLNKPALVNSFLIDTALLQETMMINYTAIDSSVKLRNLRIYFSGDHTDSLVAIMKSSNLYYKSADTLTYSGNGNYRISAWNKPRIGKEVAFLLEGKTHLTD